MLSKLFDLLENLQLSEIEKSLKETYKIVHRSLALVIGQEIPMFAYKDNWELLGRELGKFGLTCGEKIVALQDKPTEGKDEENENELKRLMDIKDKVFILEAIVKLLQSLRNFNEDEKQKIFSKFSKILKHSQKTNEKFSALLERQQTIYFHKIGIVIEKKFSEYFPEEFKILKDFFIKVFDGQIKLREGYDKLMEEKDLEDFQGKFRVFESKAKILETQLGVSFNQIAYETRATVFNYVSAFGDELKELDSQSARLAEEINLYLNLEDDSIEITSFFNLWGKFEEKLRATFGKDSEAFKAFQKNSPFANIREGKALLEFFVQIKKEITFDIDLIYPELVKAAKQQACEEFGKELRVDSFDSPYHGFNVSELSSTLEEFGNYVRNISAEIKRKEKDWEVRNRSTSSEAAHSATLGRSNSASSPYIAASLKGLSSPSKPGQATQVGVFSPERGNNFRNGSSPQLPTQNSNLPVEAGTFGELLEKMGQPVVSSPAPKGNGSLLTTSSPSSFSSPARGADKASGSSVSGMTSLSSNPGLSPTNQRHAQNGNGLLTGKHYSNGSPPSTRDSAHASPAPSPNGNGNKKSWSLSNLFSPEGHARGQQQPSSSPTCPSMQRRSEG